MDVESVTFSYFEQNVPQTRIPFGRTQIPYVIDSKDVTNCSVPRSHQTYR